MNKNYLIIIIVFSLLQSINAQIKSDILIIDSKYDISFSTENFLKEISIPRGLIKKTKKSLLKQCIDSTRLYNGNCFNVTYYDDNEFVVIKKGQDSQDYIRGKIYSLDESEIQNINTNIENYKTTKSNSYHLESIINNIDSSEVIYKANFIFQYGGESKVTILPKVNLLRVHRLNLINPYYGVEFGIHPLMIAGAFTFSGVCGVEKNIFNFETSISHFRTTRISDGENSFIGPFSQNSFNFKLGIQIKRIGVKIGTSFIINENIPSGQERIPLLDIGKINGNIYGIELLIKIK